MKIKLLKFEIIIYLFCKSSNKIVNYVLFLFIKHTNRHIIYEKIQKFIVYLY